MANDKRTYLGDGVYADFDGYQIWLTTQNGDSIALDPQVLEALNTYDKSIRDAHAAPANEGTDA